jgi:acetyl-CoA carboxylase biotin carboxyl carrier protein
MNDSSESQLPDVEYVRELAKVFQEYELDELEIEAGDRRILIRHADYATAPATTIAMAPAPVAAPLAAAPVAAAAARPATGEAAAAPAEAPGDFIISPFVGTFYRSPSPDAAAFVDVGTRIKKSQVLCIVEAMKLMNEIESEIEGVIVQILVENGQAVEYGEPLFKIKQG